MESTPQGEKHKMQEEESPHDASSHPPVAENDDREKLLVAAGGEHQLESEPPPETTTQDALSPEKTVVKTVEESLPDVTFRQYESELQLPHIMRLMKADLSEPYSIYTYRYFIHNWPNLCFLVCRLGKLVCWWLTYVHAPHPALTCTNSPSIPPTAWVLASILAAA